MQIEINDQTALCYMRVAEDGWFATTATSDELKDLIGQEPEIVFPIFPTVFTPTDSERAYYNAALDNIKEGDKILVMCCGSGADAWVAWLKAKTLIYAIDINEQAILNTYTTARMGGFEVRPVQGDIRSMELPEDFKGFDCVLGNVPFRTGGIPLEQNNYHDGDDGSVIQAFMGLLPSLLKPGGRVVLAGTEET
ncbi:unnamed protein product, partial [marine sediment metagenome]